MIAFASTSRHLNPMEGGETVLMRGPRLMERSCSYILIVEYVKSVHHGHYGIKPEQSCCLHVLTVLRDCRANPGMAPHLSQNRAVLALSKSLLNSAAASSLCQVGKQSYPIPSIELISFLSGQTHWCIGRFTWTVMHATRRYLYECFAKLQDFLK